MPKKSLSYYKSQQKRNLRYKAKKERDQKTENIPDETLESLRGINREQLDINYQRFEDKSTQTDTTSGIFDDHLRLENYDPISYIKRKKISQKLPSTEELKESFGRRYEKPKPAIIPLNKNTDVETKEKQ